MIFQILRYDTKKNCIIFIFDYIDNKRLVFGVYFQCLQVSLQFFSCQKVRCAFSLIFASSCLVSESIDHGRQQRPIPGRSTIGYVVLESIHSVDGVGVQSGGFNLKPHQPVAHASEEPTKSDRSG